MASRRVQKLCKNYTKLVWYCRGEYAVVDNPASEKIIVMDTYILRLGAVSG